MSPRRMILGLILAAAAVVAAYAGAQATETISFVYEKITWTHARQKIEDDFRRRVAARGLDISSAEITGAAQAAFNGGIEHTDTWEEQQMVIRGCGPGQKLCFVITCKRCSPR